jgi:CRP-like cAMP-binding protein
MMTLIEDLFVEKENTLKVASQQLIYLEREPALYIYYLKEGVIITYKQHERFGKLWLNFTRPGQILGITALNKPFYGHSAQALGEVELMRVSLDSVQNLMESNPLFKINLLQAICKEINQTQQKGIESYNKTLKQRIAFLLLELFRARMDFVSQPEILNISTKMITEFMGINSIKVEKTIQELEKEGLILRREQGCQILNPPDLELLFKA